MEQEEIPHNSPSKWNAIWPVLLTIAITAIVVGGSMYLFMKHRVDLLREEIATLQENEIMGNEDGSSVNDTPTPTEKTSDVLIYQSEELALSFQYPATWDEITEGVAHGHVILKSGDDIFLSADNYPYEGPDRGFGWTDLALYIKDQAFVDNFCENPIYPDHIKDCEIIESVNGITYAKTLEEIHTEGGLLGIAHTYYIFHPYADFSGIVISSIWLGDNSLFNLENTLDKLVESISFTK